MLESSQLKEGKSKQDTTQTFVDGAKSHDKHSVSFNTHVE